MERTRKRLPVPPAYRLVARMSGRELLDGLAAEEKKKWMHALMWAEARLRLMHGLKRARR